MLVIAGAATAAAAIAYMMWRRAQQSAQITPGQTVPPPAIEAGSPPSSTSPYTKVPGYIPRNDPTKTFPQSPFTPATPSPPARVSLQRPTQVVTTADVLVPRVDVRLRPSAVAELVNPNDATLHRDVVVHQTGVLELGTDNKTTYEWWLVTTPGGATGWARVREPNGVVTMFDNRLRYTGGQGPEQFPTPLPSPDGI